MANSVKLFFWLPRILCMAAILFISLFALDSFSPELTFWQQISGFLIHLIPTYFLIGFLVFAWKFELTGGIFFVALGMIFSPFLYMNNFRNNHSILISLTIILTITFPFIVIGFLFIVSYFIKNPEKKSSFMNFLKSHVFKLREMIFY